MTADEYIRMQKWKAWIGPMPAHNPSGNYIEVFFENQKCFAKTINKYVTLYYSLEDLKIIGCKLNCIDECLK